MSQNKTLTSVQRLEQLEKAMGTMVEEFNGRLAILVNEINQQKKVNKELVARINAMLQAGDQGDLSSDRVSGLMIEKQVQELKAQVDSFVELGMLVLSQEGVRLNDFVVGHEQDKNGVVLTPRVQFAVASLEVADQLRLEGKKAGDILPGDEDHLDFVIKEIYNVKEEQDLTVNEQEFQEQEEQSVSTEVFNLKK